MGASIGKMGYVRISSGVIEVNETEEQRIIIDKISGEIEKVIIKYNKKCSEDVRIRIFTSDGEKIIDVSGNQNGIYYPRNWNAMNQKYIGTNVMSEYVTPTTEKFVEDGNMLILVVGEGIDDIIDNIEIVINGIMDKQDDINEAEKADDIINKSMAYKADAPVTSDTSGVFNPIHGRRRRIKKYMEKVLGEIMKSEEINLDVEKQTEGIKEMSEFITDSVYGRKFEGVSRMISDRIKDYLVRALQKGYPVEKIRDHIARQGKGEIGIMQAEMIARTEIQALQNAVREWSYKKLDKENKFKFKWIGSKDNRICKACFELIDETEKGVSIDELRKLVKEKSNKHFPKLENREWTVHPTDRCTFVKVVD